MTQHRDIGNDEPTCRHCGGSVLIDRYEDGREGKPWQMTVAEFHEHATCLEGPEPPYRMGGPA